MPTIPNRLENAPAPERCESQDKHPRPLALPICVADFAELEKNDRTPCGNTNMNTRREISGCWTAGSLAPAATRLRSPPVQASAPTTNAPSAVAGSARPAVGLSKGKAVLVGGAGRSAQVYDCATGLFNDTGPMKVTPGGSTGSQMPNGIVLGGGASGNRAELHHPATGTGFRSPAQSPDSLVNAKTFLCQNRSITFHQPDLEWAGASAWA